MNNSKIISLNKQKKTSDLKKYLRAQWTWKSFLTIGLTILILTIVSIDLEINYITLFSNSLNYFGDIFSRMLPPDFSEFKLLVFSMIETIEIAILGTFIAITLSIPLALFSARNIAPNIFIFFLARTITVFFRAIPEFIIAMILVIAIGFGAMPGVLALGIHTMGFLAKFYAEDIEHINKGPVEALVS